MPHHRTAPERQPARSWQRPVPARPPRDLRLDVVRGWMQVSIFVSHVAGTGFAWLIHAAWGLSDSSEGFVFLSGLALGSVFGLKSARDGFAAALRDLWQRIRRLYLIHLTVVAIFAALVLWAEMGVPLPGEVDRLGWRHLAEAPWAALPELAVMLYQPEFTGILPVFIWCMLLLPGFMWLADRVGPLALMPPVALWAGVQLLGWRLPGLGGTEVALNPLAWQLLFLLGAWFGRAALLTGRAVPPLPLLTAAAAAIVTLGLLARLAGHGWLPGAGFGPGLMEGKQDLAPMRLLHMLALAWLIARLVPREAAWMGAPAGRALAAIGRHSLSVFCLGLFLSWGVTTALRLRPEAAWLDPLLVVSGVALLAGFAILAERGAATRRAAAGRAG